jgi:hypothetical protein
VEENILKLLSKSDALKSALGENQNSRLRCLIGVVTEISPNFAIKLCILADEEDL